MLKDQKLISCCLPDSLVESEILQTLKAAAEAANSVNILIHNAVFLRFLQDQEADKLVDLNLKFEQLKKQLISLTQNG